MHRKIKTIIIALALVGTLSVPVLANPAIDEQNNIIKTQKNEIDKNKKEIEKNKKVYDKVLKEVQDIEIKIEKFDSKIEKMLRNMDDANKKIEKTNEKISLTQMELDKAQADIKSEQEIFSKRARNLYMNGADSYLEIILNSKGLHDFVSRIENLRAISAYDKKIMKELKEKQEKFEKKKIELQNEKKNLIVLKQNIEKDLEEVKKSKKDQEILIAEVNKKKEKYESIINEFNEKISSSQNKINEANGKINDINRPVPTQRPSRGGGYKDQGSYNVPTSGPAAQRAVAIAKQFLGRAYVWGGSSPSRGFDCSGLVQYSYGQVGIGLGRTTYDQINDGMAVRRDQLQVGDLILFGSSNDPHHVGLYVGNGQYIHAPQTGDVIKISSLQYRGDYLTARRVAY